jgi:tRNA(Ile)-lysidine synthase
MQNFARNLLTEWRKLKLPFTDQTFVVAVSGGADSVSLLLALYELKKLKKLNLRFVIAHFNHDLRGAESEKDLQFVKNLAFELNFELALGKEKIPTEGNLEQNARLARYKFLYETAENLHAQCILTAHTVNDQAETFLINLIRGSGIEGLGGMKVVRDLVPIKSKTQNLKSKIQLVRPLLSWAKRADTENFCRRNNVEFQYDKMNEDLAFKRVRIRKILLPLLEDFNPKIVETLAKTATLLRQDFEDLQTLYESKFQHLDGELRLKVIKILQPSVRRRVLREWLKNHRGDLRGLDSKHLEAIERLIFSQKSGKTIELPNKESIVKEKGKLTFKQKNIENDLLSK